MTYRRSESPAVSALFGIVVGALCAAAGYVEGAKAKPCPSVTGDGRSLVAQDTRGARCLYSPPARGIENIPTIELRRIVMQRERMEGKR